MDLQAITLVSYGYFGNDTLEKTAEAVIQEYHCPVIIKDGHIDLSEYYDASRRQYNGNGLLKYMDVQIFPDALKILGLFNVDLFIPILTFIFGQAFLGGRSGISSVYRLSNERYGMKENNLLMQERFKKEVNHELGHMFGLIHCQNPKCVMRSSTYVEDIDQKDQHLCIRCATKLRS